MQYNFKLKADRLRFYKSKVWRGKNGIRNQRVKMDNNECVWCRAQGLVMTKYTKKFADEAESKEGKENKLEVDHIIELEDCTYEQAIDLNNLRTLCTYHHNVRHNRFEGKQENKWDDEKW